MEADFSGYATKAGLVCSDGKTIMPNAFADQDQTQVPLVWQHGHKDVSNVLGHAILENRPDGVYAYGFFNETEKAKHAAQLLEHGDISQLSIWANKLIQRGGQVLHGAIREVSLVLAGANPGAVIESVTIRHSDHDLEELDDEAIIFTGEEIEIAHADGDDDDDDDDDGPTIQEVFDTFNDQQKEVVHYLVGEALESKDSTAKHDALGEDATVQQVYDSMNEQQKNVLHYMVGEAIENNNVEHDAMKGNNMGHNVFEDTDQESGTTYQISHAQMGEILGNAKTYGSLKQAVEQFSLAHSIEDVELLFPDAVAVENTPEFLSRRTEWVDKVLSTVHKSPLARIKTFHADITEDEARAKGYIKGEFKKEEFFPVVKRTTSPTTIYKKQKLDRDDIIDITDFNVVVWLKAEMRLMLDEELARCILIGDGRDISDEDKINEQCIRPVATDHELYTTKLYVNLGDANSSISEAVDAIIINRSKYKGSGTPTFFTSESFVGKVLTLRDEFGHRIYKNLDELAVELRVKEIVPVEVMPEDMIGIMVNLVDYQVGTNAGGQVSMFDDFDIDYNQHKYLIETRCSGALTKLKSAIVVIATGSSAALAVPQAPTYNEATGVITIPTVTGVTYKNGASTVTGTVTVPEGDSVTITAVPTSSSYYFATSDDDEWTFDRPDEG